MLRRPFLSAAIFIAATLPFSASAQNSPEYWYVASTERNSVLDRAYYIDRARVERTTPSTRTFWVWVYRDRSEYDYVISRQVANCARRTLMLMQTTYYFPDGSAHTDPHSTDESFVNPNSVGESLVDFACADHSTQPFNERVNGTDLASHFRYLSLSQNRAPQ